MPSSQVSIRQKLRVLFTRKEAVRFGMLFGAILLMAFLEVVGIAAIMPFMTLVADPTIIEQNEWLRWAYETFGFTSHRSMLIATGVGVLLMLAIANSFAAFTTWVQYKVAWTTAHGVSTRLVHTYVSQPYEFFLIHNTADMVKKVLSEVNMLVNGVLLMAIDLVARTLVSLVIFGLLLFVDAQLALIVFTVLGGAYAVIYTARRRYLNDLGESRLAANLDRYKTLNEVLTGIKTVQVQGTERYFFNRFAQSSRRLTSIYPKFQLISQTPRYFVEVIAFGGILTITLYLLATEQNMQAILPLLSLYALAGYRLLPSLQRVFIAATQIRHTFPVIDEYYQDLRLRQPETTGSRPGAEPLAFEDRIVLKHVSFRYQGSERPVLDDLLVTIPKGARVAFVGSTGSGKTTLVDLIIGLLPPSNGSLWIDDVQLTRDTAPAWRKRIGYVPQEVFLYDDSVSRNIAFGINERDIDPHQVRQAARMANLHEFIERELPQGYDTEIGERGVRLSGGQRQRLGLARALYRQPAVLVLDEATSALDGITEKAVVEAIESYADNLTMITIAHRLSTVKQSDCIYLLEEGRIVGRGTYDELLASNATFRSMAKLTS